MFNIRFMCLILSFVVFGSGCCCSHRRSLFEGVDQSIPDYDGLSEAKTEMDTKPNSTNTEISQVGLKIVDSIAEAPSAVLNTTGDIVEAVTLSAFFFVIVPSCMAFGMLMQ